MVLVDYVYYFVVVDVDCFGDVVDFVGEGDFGGVLDVVGVFDYFGDFDGFVDDWCV